MELSVKTSEDWITDRICTANEEFYGYACEQVTRYIKIENNGSLESVEIV